MSLCAVNCELEELIQKYIWLYHLFFYIQHSYQVNKNERSVSLLYTPTFTYVAELRFIVNVLSTEARPEPQQRLACPELFIVNDERSIPLNWAEYVSLSRNLNIIWQAIDCGWEVKFCRKKDSTWCLTTIQDRECNKIHGLIIEDLERKDVNCWHLTDGFFLLKSRRVKGSTQEFSSVLIRVIRCVFVDSPFIIKCLDDDVKGWKLVLFPRPHLPAQPAEPGARPELEKTPDW